MWLRGAWWLVILLEGAMSKSSSMIWFKSFISFDLLGIQQTNKELLLGWMLFSLCCWCWYSCWCCGWIVPIWRQSMHQPEDECWCNQRKMQSNVWRRSDVFFFKNPYEFICPLSFIAGCLLSKRYLWTITRRRLESFMLTDYVNTQIVYVKPLPLFSRWRNTLWVGLGGGGEGMGHCHPIF